MYEAAEALVSDAIKLLPSAETPTVLEKHQLSEETPTNTPTDLINRQDAIDALGEEPDIWNDTEDEWTYRNAWVEHISAIKSLPSATSQSLTKPNKSCEDDLIRRRDAVNAVLEITMYQGRVPVDTVMYRISNIPSADRPTGWIPVSERLPDAEYGEGDSVLCCTETGLMYILYWNGGNWCAPTGEPHQWVNHRTGWHDKVIAWMPLPEPYGCGAKMGGGIDD